MSLVCGALPSNVRVGTCQGYGRLAKLCRENRFACSVARSNKLNGEIAQNAREVVWRNW